MCVCVCVCVCVCDNRHFKKSLVKYWIKQTTGYQHDIDNVARTQWKCVSYNHFKPEVVIYPYAFWNLALISDACVYCNPP